jgi:streptogramin lyase
MIADTVGGYVWGFNGVYNTIWRITTSDNSISQFTSIDVQNLWYDKTTGDLYKGDADNFIYKLSKTNATVSASLNTGAYVFDCAFDSDGNAWTTSTSSKVLRKITPAGAVTSYTLSSTYNLSFIAYDSGRDSLWVSTGGSTLGELLEVSLVGAIVQTLSLAPGTGSNYPALFYVSSAKEIWTLNPTANKINKVTTKTALLKKSFTSATLDYSGQIAPYSSTCLYVPAVETSTSDWKLVKICEGCQLVLLDTAGHYWGVTISTAGALTTTDLGTTKP